MTMRKRIGNREGTESISLAAEPSIFHSVGALDQATRYLWSWRHGVAFCSAIYIASFLRLLVLYSVRASTALRMIGTQNHPPL